MQIADLRLPTDPICDFQLPISDLKSRRLGSAVEDPKIENRKSEIENGISDLKSSINNPKAGEPR